MTSDTSDQLPTVRGHEAHFLQLFQNLLDNAIKYRGQNAPRIHVAAARVEGTWHLSVADNGIGIEKGHLNRIFEMFFVPTNRKSGSGLGLYIVKETVRKLKRGRLVRVSLGRWP